MTQFWCGAAGTREPLIHNSAGARPDSLLVGLPLQLAVLRGAGRQLRCKRRCSLFFVLGVGYCATEKCGMCTGEGAMPGSQQLLWLAGTTGAAGLSILLLRLALSFLKFGARSMYVCGLLVCVWEPELHVAVFGRLECPAGLQGSDSTSYATL
jgi:hypothetical protein